VTASPPPLRGELADFIEAAIPSVWALEVLLLLRQPPAAGWRPDSLVAELRASPTLVADCLAGLQRAGVAASDGETFRYAPVSPTLSALCDELEAAYRERPVAVVNMIAKRRPDPLKGFADSFRLKGWRL
jgi:hypothetical protein